MSSIKKHQCPSCGGNLIIDNDKQMYHCTFCGSAYNYEYFREDQMLQMGETYLLRGEFNAAVDAYKFTLKKDPHDFLALRGLMLAAAHLNDMNDLIREDHSRGFSYDAGLVSEAFEGASDKDKGYFIDLREIYSDMNKLSELYDEIDSLSENRRKSGEAIRSNEVVRKDCFIEYGDGKERSPVRSFIINWIIYGIVVLNTLPIIIFMGSDYGALFIDIILISIYIFIPIMNLTVVYPRIKKKKALDKSIGELSSKSDGIGERLKVLDAEAEKLAGSIRTSSHDFVKKDILIMRDLKS